MVLHASKLHQNRAVDGWMAAEGKRREIISKKRKGQTGHYGSREMGFRTWTRNQELLVGYKSESKTESTTVESKGFRQPV